MVVFVDKTRIEELVGTKIKNLDLYQRAFTHKSALKEYEQFTESFETLEFIGDSVLGFVITKFLFDRYESKQEGFLTKARTKLVRGETLAKIAMASFRFSNKNSFSPLLKTVLTIPLTSEETSFSFV